jgi:transcriptional regulator with XRE-family HTH domain
MQSIWNNNTILKARIDAGLSGRAAAEVLQITPEYLSMIENGKNQPSQKLLLRMADLYKVPLASFLQPENYFIKTT